MSGVDGGAGAVDLPRGHEGCRGCDGLLAMAACGSERRDEMPIASAPELPSCTAVLRHAFEARKLVMYSVAIPS
ncbi:MAG TPA: hypothetical protein VFT35_02395, partial [Gaiellaceae bacterium]|nr:hypothetical protein [Gaiellaceae bacterium]